MKHSVATQNEYLTIVVEDDYGEIHDLNAEGAPVRTHGELREFIRELEYQGAYGAETRKRLIEEMIAF